MLQPHSLLWHYLWVAPNLLFLCLGAVLWRRKVARQFPAFFAFMLFSSILQLALYVADILPSVDAQNFWRMETAVLLIEALLKFLIIGEIFAIVLGSYASLARLGRFLIRFVGVILVLTAALAAAYAPGDSVFGIISKAHLLGQTIYLVECGMLTLIFGISFYFHLRLARSVFGIALGLSISSCIHLASLAVVANAGLPDESRVLFDFLNMATYHACVLIWSYFLLVPGPVVVKAAIQLPETNLDVWNRELERLVHQ
jgi:hypothetical protein